MTDNTPDDNEVTFTPSWGGEPRPQNAPFPRGDNPACVMRVVYPTPCEPVTIILIDDEDEAE